MASAWRISVPPEKGTACRKGGRSGDRRSGCRCDCIPDDEREAKEGEEHADGAERSSHLD